MSSIESVCVLYSVVVSTVLSVECIVVYQRLSVGQYSVHQIGSLLLLLLVGVVVVAVAVVAAAAAAVLDYSIWRMQIVQAAIRSIPRIWDKNIWIHMYQYSSCIICYFFTFAFAYTLVWDILVWAVRILSLLLFHLIPLKDFLSSLFPFFLRSSVISVSREGGGRRRHTKSKRRKKRQETRNKWTKIQSWQFVFSTLLSLFMVINCFYWHNNINNSLGKNTYFTMNSFGGVVVSNRAFPFSFFQRIFSIENINHDVSPPFFLLFPPMANFDRWREGFVWGRLPRINNNKTVSQFPFKYFIFIFIQFIKPKNLIYGYRKQ